MNVATCDTDVSGVARMWFMFPPFFSGVFAAGSIVGTKGLIGPGRSPRLSITSGDRETVRRVFGVLL